MGNLRIDGVENAIDSFRSSCLSQEHSLLPLQIWLMDLSLLFLD